jgi:glycosyltransferase involved in cell wall biosynthesis
VPLSNENHDKDKTMKISVVMPVYNEIRTIDAIIARVLAVGIDKELIIVDDCSRDGTRAKLEQMAKALPAGADIRIFFHEENQGKGAALRTGIAQAQGDIVIIQDADLEYDPEEYHQLIQPILDGRADVVYGSRFLGGPHRVLFFWHYVGNRFLTLLSNMFTNLNLTDMETCYKVFKREIIQGIIIKSNRFGFEPEITAKIARKHCRIYETSISYSGRDYSEGKKIGWKDGFSAIWCIVRYWLAD